MLQTKLEKLQNIEGVEGNGRLCPVKLRSHPATRADSGDGVAAHIEGDGELGRAFGCGRAAFIAGFRVFLVAKPLLVVAAAMVRVVERGVGGEGRAQFPQEHQPSIQGVQ